MNITLVSYLKIPLQYFQYYSSKFPQNSKSKYSVFFKNLQESLIKNFNFSKFIFSLNPSGDTALKTESLATKMLQPTAKITSETINLTEILPLDVKTTLKKLDNDFTYYIRDNAYPSKKTASLRLVIRAGSTDEEEHEQGIAHFLEHLLFNETENLGKHEIKHFLESKGAIFGADQNAHTSFNETVYKFDIPLNDSELMDKTLYILSEMATKATISDSSVEEERAVILDEISNETAGSRYRKKLNAILLEGTPYPNRNPAGLKKIIQECTPDQIRAFYRRTYLPQNMALVCVGDFDQAQVEGLIKKYFSNISPSSIPLIKHEFQPVERKEPQFVCHSDPECTAPILQLHYPLKSTFDTEEITIGSLRQGMINSLYNIMFNNRLQEIITDCESSPFIYANGQKNELVDNIFYYYLSLVASDDSIPAAYKRLLLELKRVHEHGFLPEELESAKKSYKMQLEHLGIEKNHISNKEFATSYVSHFIDGSPFADIAKTIEIKKNLVGFINLDQVNRWSKVLTLSKGPIVSTFLPETIADTVNPEILKKISEEVFAETVIPYVDSFIDRPLLRKIPQPGKVVTTIAFEKTGIIKWTLENGMNVYVRPSLQNEDSVLIYATSVGGEFSFPFEKRAAADVTADLYARSGLVGLTPSQLKKNLKEKNVGQKIIIGKYLTSLLTTSSKKDLESAFQLLYIAYADRTFRKEAFNTIKKENLNAIKHRNNNPNVIFDDIEKAICTQNHPRSKPITAEEYEKLDYEEVIDFLNNQFQNPGNFDLVITGNVDVETTKGLIEKYIAGIPGQGNKTDSTSFKYPIFEYPCGVVVKEIEASIANHCQTRISFPSAAQDTMESRQFGLWTARLLTMHLYDRLRFIKAENYSINCDYAISILRGQEKTDQSSMKLEISGLPENIRALNDIVLKEIEKLQNEGFTAEELSTYRTQVKEAYRKALDMDSTWIACIAHQARWGWDINTMVEDFHRMIDEFDEKVAQEQLKELFPLNNYVQLTMLPKKIEADSLRVLGKEAVK